MFFLSFQELDGTVNRVIEKCDVLQVGLIYRMVDVYSLRIDGRIAYVGGVRREEDDECIYIWLPTGLSKNFTEKKVVDLKLSLEKGKKAYLMYKGMKKTQYGTNAFDICWMPKPK